MDAGRTIRVARHRAGLTQAALANRVGTSQATISAYENGSKQPSVATFSRLLAALGSRLSVEPGQRPVIQPSSAQLAHVGRLLPEVLGLAEALPVRHEPTLRYPPLNALVNRST